MLKMYFLTCFTTCGWHYLSVINDTRHLKILKITWVQKWPQSADYVPGNISVRERLNADTPWYKILDIWCIDIGCTNISSIRYDISTKDSKSLSGFDWENTALLGLFWNLGHSNVPTSETCYGYILLVLWRLL